MEIWLTATNNKLIPLRQHPNMKKAGGAVCQSGGRIETEWERGRGSGGGGEKGGGEEERVGNPRYVFPVPLSRFKFLDLIIRLLEARINIEKAFADVTLCCLEKKGVCGGGGGHPRHKRMLWLAFLGVALQSFIFVSTSWHWQGGLYIFSIF